MLRHERQTVAVEVAAALHHSRDAVRGTNIGPGAQKTASLGQRPGVLTELEPQEGAVTVGYVAAPVPLLAVPLLAGAAGEAVDAHTLSFLLAWSLAEKKVEEEERKKQVQEATELNKKLLERLTAEGRRDLEQRLDSGGASSKRKKKRRKRLPKASSLGCDVVRALRCLGVA